MAWKLIPGPLFLLRMQHKLSWKIKFLKQVDFTEYVIAKLSEYVKISMQCSSDSILQMML